MIVTERAALIWAGLLGTSGVFMGALGAHALRGGFDGRQAALFNTASVYHLVHAAAMLAGAALIRSVGGAHRAGALFVLTTGVGTVIFSGTLYALALGAPKWLGAITPVGGSLMVLGWAALLWFGVRGGG